jgi:thioredoxin-dependent peroxiredoxin
MEVKYKKEFYILKQKERKIGTEAPAVKVKMLNEESKVIGMMAPKIQVMITLPDIKDYTNGLNDILKKHASKLLVYIITSSILADIERVQKPFDIDPGFISNDFEKFSLKFGVNLSESLVAKSIYIIDKEGEIKYKEIPENSEHTLDLDEFESALEEVINFKVKGHTHENWMGV